jgi:hypothetical protein
VVSRRSDKLEKCSPWWPHDSGLVQHREAGNKLVHRDARLESTYGAAASIVVLLIWVYYSAQIVLFGAEMTHVLDARQRE